MSSFNNSIMSFIVNNTSNNTGGATQSKTVYCAKLGGCVPADIFIFVISIVGIIANAFVFVIVVWSKKLRKPMYFGIGLLSFPDAIFLLAKILRLTLIYALIKNFSIARTLDTIIVTSNFASLSHVVLLSWQQYMYIAHPIKSHIWFTIRRLILVSTAIWIFSFGLAMAYMCVLIFFHQEFSRSSKMVFIKTITILSTVIPVLLLFVLFALKTSVLKSALVDRRSVPMKRMSKIVGFVVIVFIVCTLPLNIRDILNYSFHFKARTIWGVFYTQISHVLYYCNFMVNPFFYVFLSPQFRKIFKRKRQKDEVRTAITEI